MNHLAPLDIRFSQDSIRSRFQDGRSVMQAIFDIRNGRMKATDFPTISVKVMDGNYYTCDNRRLYVFRVLQCEGILNTVPVYRTSYIDYRKFTTENQGVSIRIIRHCKRWFRIPYSYFSRSFAIQSVAPSRPTAPAVLSISETGSTIKPPFGISLREIREGSRRSSQLISGTILKPISTNTTSHVSAPESAPIQEPDCSAARPTSLLKRHEIVSQPESSSAPSTGFNIRESIEAPSILKVRPSAVSFSLPRLSGKINNLNKYCEIMVNNEEERKLIFESFEPLHVYKEGSHYIVIPGDGFNMKLYICRVLEYCGKVSEIRVKIVTTPPKLPLQPYSELQTTQYNESLLPHSNEDVLAERIQSL
ncbi:uncharacterized protein LOC144743474 [Ciona intestinalis]